MTRGRKPPICPDPAQLRALIDAGAQLKDVCSYFGKANKTIRKWMLKFGVERATRKQRPRGVTPSYVQLARSPKTGKRFETKIYLAWRGIQRRCCSEHPMNPEYYAERGIRLHPDWTNYDTFRSWCLANGVRKEFTFQRINMDGDYEPSNCRWDTRATMAEVGRTTDWLTFNGETLPSPVWAKRFGIHPQHVRARLRSGWTVEQALTTPKGQPRIGYTPKPRGRKPYPPELREVMAAHRALKRAIERREREEQDR